jgi:tRNA dimethylallyltransferase
MLEQGANRGPLIAIVGPTAVGKSALALDLASVAADRFGRAVELVSADSRQVFRGLNIGTAKPTAEEQRIVRHHVIDVVDPEDDFTLAEFQDRAYLAIDEILARGALPVLVGGTGLYAWTVLNGTELPRVPPDLDLRAQLEEVAGRGGAEALHRQLRERDPLAAARIDPRNVRRVIRALEVTLKSGRPFSEVTINRPRYAARVIGLTTEREALYRKIDERVDRQLANGLIDETRRVLEQGCPPHRPALSGFGYRQVVQFLLGELDLAAATERYKFETHRFARQQYTWFRLADSRIHWIEATPRARNQAADLICRHVESTASQPVAEQGF